MSLITAVNHGDMVSITDPETQVFNLESAYVSWVESREQDERRGVFHPSAVGMCGRRNVYEYLGFTRQQAVKAPDLEVFRLGHAVHHIVQTILADLGSVLTPLGIAYTFQAEVPYDPKTDTLMRDLGIGGTCDGLLTMTHANWTQRSVIEIKSIKGELYDKLKKPKPDHRMQANLYAYRFDVPIIYYWYYNKNTSDRKVYVETADEATLNEAISRFVLLRGYADSYEHAKELPEREESFYMCPRCEYNHVCEPKTLTRIREKQRYAQARSRGFGTKGT